MSRRSEIPTTPDGLRKYQRVIDDQDICIGCGACVSVCPTNAWELDENGKARLIWDWCIDDFSCVPVCPRELHMEERGGDAGGDQAQG